MNEIDYEELAERLGEVTLIDVRTDGGVLGRRRLSRAAAGMATFRVRGTSR